MHCKPLVFAALLCGGLTACQPIPQPFSHAETGRTVPLDLPDSGGIVVLEIADAPPATATALARAVATALGESNVPASTGTGNRRSHFLQGSVEDNGRAAAIVWTLYDARGKPVDTLRQSIEGISVPAWASAEQALMTRLAHRIAPKIAALVQNAAPAENTVPPLYVADVSGAPGLGNRQLRGALRRHLADTGLAVTDTTGSRHLTVSGEVNVGPVSGDRQQATLDWRVLDPDGVEVGRISQSNPVAAGSLDASWGRIADIVARGAADGIADLVRSVDWTDRYVAKNSMETSGTEAPSRPR